MKERNSRLWGAGDLMFYGLLASFSWFASPFLHADPLPICGKPDYDKTREAAAFVYNDCGTDLWHLRVTAGGSAISYQGSLSAEPGFDSITDFSYEAGDLLLPSGFIMNVGGPGEDGIDFSFQGTACLRIETSPAVPVIAGSDRLPVGRSVSLPDFGACDAGHAFVLSATSIVVDESIGTAFFDIGLDPAPGVGESVVIDFESVDGSAEAGVDYTGLTGSLTFASGESNKMIPLLIDDDPYPESSETFDLVLTGSEVNVVTTTATILDNDSGPQCGVPSYNKATESGFFVYNDCGTNTWHIRGAAGGQSLSYQGSVTADRPFDSLATFYYEASDVVQPAPSNAPLGNAISFEMNVSGEGQDGLDFEVPTDATACLSLTMPSAVRVKAGVNMIAVGSSFNLTDFGPCDDALSRPNIVLIVTDDQRWDSLWSMPKLSEIAEEGIRFDNAYVSDPLCGPSRASLLSGGNYPKNTGVLGNEAAFYDFDDSHSMAVQLHSAGYRTGLVGKYLNHYPLGYIPPGWDYFKERVSYDWSALTADATDFINDPDPAPFFLYYATYAPHYPATVEPQDADLYLSYLYRDRAFNEQDLSDKPMTVQGSASSYNDVYFTSQAEQDEYHRNQLRTQMAADRSVEALLQSLDDTGKRDNTLIIFMSDNGYLWGEHGLWSKSRLYEESTRVPLVLSYPGITARGVEHLVEANLDVGATILELAGISGGVTDGESLVPFFYDSAPVWRKEILLEVFPPGSQGSNAEPASTQVGGIRSFELGEWKYVEWGTGEIELYDLTVDPFEMESKHKDPAYRDELGRLAEKLAGQKGLAMRSLLAPVGRVGDDYRFRLIGWGGNGSYVWQLDDDELPLGLSFNRTTNRIEGVPAESGQFPISVAVESTTAATYANRNQSFDWDFIIEIRAADDSGSFYTMSDVIVSEADDVAQFSVVLSAPVDEWITVRYSTMNSAAFAGPDYVPESGMLEFAPGQTEQFISVPIVDDNVAEAAETFELMLFAARGAHIGDAFATGTILDDD